MIFSFLISILMAAVSPVSAVCDRGTKETFNCPGVPAPACEAPGLFMCGFNCPTDSIPFAVATFSCDFSCYSSVGTPQMFYDVAKGEWTGTCLTCEKASFVCSQPKVPEGATVSLSNDPPDCGSIAFLTCPSDALPSFSPDQCIRKPGTLDEGTWLSDQSGIGIICHKKMVGCPLDGMEAQCGSTTKPLGATAATGAKINWKPQEGCQFLGEVTSECQEDGTWSHPVPCCYCGAVPEGVHLNVKEEPVSSGGSLIIVVTLEIDRGTLLLGPLGKTRHECINGKFVDELSIRACAGTVDPDECDCLDYVSTIPLGSDIVTCAAGKIPRIADKCYINVSYRCQGDEGTKSASCRQKIKKGEVIVITEPEEPMC